jgi:hypothetical protein
MRDVELMVLMSTVFDGPRSERIGMCILNSLVDDDIAVTDKLASIYGTLRKMCIA